MTEPLRESEKQREAKPGSGVDRSQIRRLLALTPQERLELFVVSARNVAQFLASASRVSALKEQQEKLGPEESAR